MCVTAAHDAAEYRLALVRKMRCGGVLDDPAWFRAFATVPREAFLRGGVLQQADGPLGTWWQPLTPDDPGFLHEVYRDVPLATQVNGHITASDLMPGSGATGAATCSSSQPSLMALMLDHLRVEPDMTVLEIGTGVGYNAAILATHVGADRVTTIEFDTVLAETARAALTARGGTAPTVVTGDGTQGHASRAPYDRLIATCGFPDVPQAWLGQVRPGGLIVANLYQPLGTGLLAVLRVQPDGTALGRVAADSGGFMPTRAITTVNPAARHRAAWRTLSAADTRPSPLAIDALDDAGFRFHAGLSVPAADFEVIADDPRETERWLFADDGSVARARPAQDGTTVLQDGPVPLWTALEDAHDTYQRLGMPGRGTYRIAVTEKDQYVWHPGQPEKHWPLTSSSAGDDNPP